MYPIAFNLPSNSTFTSIPMPLDLMQGNWYVLRTKPKQEIRAQENLTAWGLETLLPLLPGKSKQRIARRDAIRVLFPSYIFCRFPETMLDKVRFTHGVSYVVSFGSGPAVVDQDIIDAIRARVNDHGVVQSAAAVPELQPGDRVMIEAGPFQNLIGVIETETPDSERVQIMLDTVRLKAKIECSRTEVRKVS